MTQQNSRRTPRGEATRARILDAARDLLRLRGFQHVTMADVAQRAGVAKGTPYRHWPSKEAMVIELLASDSQVGIEEVADELATDPGLVAPGRMFVRLLHFALDRPQLQAIQVQDFDLVGTLAADPRSREIVRAVGAPALVEHLVKVWRAHHLARTDRQAEQQAYILEMLVLATLESSGRAPEGYIYFAPEMRDEAVRTAVDDYLGIPGIDTGALEAAAHDAIDVLLRAARTPVDSSH